MALDKEEAKKTIVEEFTRKSKSKSKFYFNDISKMFAGESPRAVKK